MYTGIATDVARRFSEHDSHSAKGSKYLRSRGPLQLVYQVNVGSRALAQQAEWCVKSLPKQRKEEIVATRPDTDALLGLLGLTG